MPAAGVSPVGWQDDLRTVGSAMRDASAPDCAVSVFHDVMAVDVWQRAARRDMELGFSFTEMHFSGLNWQPQFR